MSLFKKMTVGQLCAEHVGMQAKIVIKEATYNRFGQSHTSPLDLTADGRIDYVKHRYGNTTFELVKGNGTFAFALESDHPIELQK